MATAGRETGRRRRRSPEEAEREILRAAEDLLRERPFRDLTVDEVMARTGLSRPSFYVYFSDRHDLLLRLVDDIGGELFAGAGSWLEGLGDDPEGEARAALRAVAAVYCEHGPVLRAIADAAAADERVDEAYNAGLMGGFIDSVTAQIEREVARGRAVVADPRRTAEALVWMHERMFTQRLGSEPRDDPDAVVDALHTALVRVVYGR